MSLHGTKTRRKRNVRVCACVRARAWKGKAVCQLVGMPGVAGERGSNQIWALMCLSSTVTVFVANSTARHHHQQQQPRCAHPPPRGYYHGHNYRRRGTIAQPKKGKKQKRPLRVPPMVLLQSRVNSSRVKRDSRLDLPACAPHHTHTHGPTRTVVGTHAVDVTPTRHKGGRAAPYLQLSRPRAPLHRT